MPKRPPSRECLDETEGRSAYITHEISSIMRILLAIQESSATGPGLERCGRRLHLLSFLHDGSPNGGKLGDLSVLASS